MRNYNLQVRCSICSDTEIITSNNYDKKIHELMNDAYQADNLRINPYYKLPNRVLSGVKGDPNWEFVPLCKTCRDEWENTVLPDLAQTLNDFVSGGS